MPIKGHVLRVIDYKDTSALLYVYTEEGIKSMIARGVKKMQSPLRHLAQPTNKIEMTLSQSKLPTLKEASLIDYYKGIKGDLLKSTIMNVINEMIYFNVGEHDDHSKLLAFIHKLAKKIEQTEYPVEYLLIFELKFLFFTGYAVPLKHCHVCTSKENLSFDLYEGALVCDNHKILNHQNYSKEIYQPMQYYYYVDVLKFDPLKLETNALKQILDITSSLNSMHLGFYSKAKKILLTLID